MTLSRVLVALTILTTLSALVHRYVWVRLVRAPGWPGAWQPALTAAAITLAILVPLSFLAIRGLPRVAAVPIAWIAYPWMGFLLYLFLLTVASDVVRGFSFLAGALPHDPERRKVLARSLAGIVGAASGVIGVGGLVNVARGFEVKHVRIPLARLPASASGYSIVQITDVHVGPTLGRPFAEQIVAQVNALSADLVVITGDLVDGTVDELRDLVEPLRGLRARDGVFFVTGNHEYYSGANEWIAHLGTLGIRVLRNERVSIRGAFDLAGVDDSSAHRMLAGHGQDIPRALEGRDPSRAVVLLAHQPKAVHDAARCDVDLQISGHVHGGQLVPFNWLARLDQPFISGLHRMGTTQVYVSTGTGYWGPPMRVGPRSEVTRIELVAG
jgi:hypothetical protein